MNIHRVSTEAERKAVFPVLRELRSGIEDERFEELYERMVEEGHRLFAAYENGNPVSVAGVVIRTNFYLGRHAFVYDLVTTESRRSEGFGRELLEFVHEWARERDCEFVELESGHWREKAHEFYTNQLNYEKYCYSFRYELQAIESHRPDREVETDP